MIELKYPIREHERVVIRKRNDAGPEPNPLSDRSSMRNEKFRRRNDLIATRVMFPDPRLVIALFVQLLH